MTANILDGECVARATTQHFVVLPALVAMSVISEVFRPLDAAKGYREQLENLSVCQALVRHTPMIDRLPLQKN